METRPLDEVGSRCALYPEGAEVTRVELVHHKFETMGAEAGASMRKDVDGGWPGLIERFVREAERGGK